MVTETENYLAVVEQSGLEPESANGIKLAFAPLFDQAEEWRQKVANIKVTDATQVREMKLARETRLALREIRIKADKVRKTLKEDSLRRGKAIDGVYNVLEFIVAPLEESLLEQEKFVERQESERKARLKASREAELASYGVDPAAYNLSELAEDQFAKIVMDAKTLQEARAEAARRIEEERIKREAKEAQERKRMEEENARLKEEAKKREAERLEAEKKAKAEQVRLRAIADAERKKRSAAELAERKEREKALALATERRERGEAEEAAQAEAARKKAAAPDKQNMLAYADAITRIDFPPMKTEKARAAAVKIQAMVKGLVSTIRGQAEKL